MRDLEAKAQELELDKKLETFADQADHDLREAASRPASTPHENREPRRGALDKAGAKVDEKTDGKYTRYVEKVRAGVLVGVDWVAEQREARHDDGGGSSDAGADVGCRRDGIRHGERLDSHAHRLDR